MTKEQLKNALGDIHIKDDMRERITSKCTQKKAFQKQIYFKRAIRPIIACVVIIAFSFSTVFAFSADFRDYVISFFKSDQIERPPLSTYMGNELDSSNYIRYIGHQKIENVSDVRYYEMSGGVIGYNGYVVIAEDYYKIGEESLVSVTPIAIKDSIQLRNHVFDLDFKYVIEDSQIQILENKSTIADGKVVSPMWTKGTEFVWLYIGVRNEFYSCIQYNLKTGEVRDIIKESGLPIEYSKDVDGVQTTLSPSGKFMLIHDFKDQAFLLNIKDLSYISLDVLCTEGMELSLSFIDDQTLSVKKWKEEGEQDKWLYTFSSFDLESQEEMILVSDIPNSQRGTRLGFWGIQQGMIILVEESQYVLVNPKTGEQYPIENLNPDADIFFLISPNNKKIAVASSSKQGDLSFTQLGYIDIEKREFRVFDRKEFSESGLFWIDNSRLVLPTNTDDSKNWLLCIYEFK